MLSRQWEEGGTCNHFVGYMRYTRIIHNHINQTMITNVHIYIYIYIYTHNMYIYSVYIYTLYTQLY